MFAGQRLFDRAEHHEDVKRIMHGKKLKTLKKTTFVDKVAREMNLRTSFMTQVDNACQHSKWETTKALHKL